MRLLACCLALALLLAGPCLVALAAQDQAGQAVPGAGQAGQALPGGGTALPAGSGATAGIPPVDPAEFAGKIEKAADAVHKAAAPVADGLAKLMLAAGGLLALAVLFTGFRLLVRVVLAALCVGLGLALFYGAPYIVGLMKGFIAWFGKL